MEVSGVEPESYVLRRNARKVLSVFNRTLQSGVVILGYYPTSTGTSSVEYGVDDSASIC